MKPLIIHCAGTVMFLGFAETVWVEGRYVHVILPGASTVYYRGGAALDIRWLDD